MLTSFKLLMTDPVAWGNFVRKQVNWWRGTIFGIGMGLQTGMIPNPFPKDTLGWYIGGGIMILSLIIKSSGTHADVVEAIKSMEAKDLAAIKNLLASIPSSGEKGTEAK